MGLSRCHSTGIKVFVVIKNKSAYALKSPSQSFLISLLIQSLKRSFAILSTEIALHFVVFAMQS